MISGAIFNYKVQPWSKRNGVPLRRILTNPGREYRSYRGLQEFSLYLDLEGNDSLEPRSRVPKYIASASGFIRISGANLMQVTLGATFKGHCLTCKRMWANRCVRTLRSVLAMKSTALPTLWQAFPDSKALAFENQLDRAMPTNIVAA